MSKRRGMRIEPEYITCEPLEFGRLQLVFGNDTQRATVVLGLWEVSTILYELRKRLGSWGESLAIVRHQLHHDNVR